MKILSLLLFFILLSILFIKIKRFITMKNHKYDGLVLFDIDGTLTTGTENERVVQYFLDRNYAVGISTAGSMYNPKNIMKFNWMPKNLWFFMIKNNFNTFNNIMSNILCGKFEPSIYNYNIDKVSISNVLGWKKGISLKKTAEIYNITNPKKIVLLDNDPDYIRGVRLYNPDFSIICAGKPCSNENLSMKTINKYFNSFKAGTFNLFNP